MPEEMNGASMPVPAMDQKAAMAQLNAVLNQNIKIIIETLARGIVTGLPPGLPHHEGMKIACFQFGFVLGSMFQADIATTAKIKAELRAAVEEGFRKAPLMAPQVGAPVPGFQGFDPAKMRG